jgi:fructuronate reductase
VRLSPATLERLAPEVCRPDYDRDSQASGIVHFGIGAFHRAHQAWYTDAAMNLGDRDWAITGVSLRSASVADQMNPQAGWYTVTERVGDARATRLIGSVRQVLVASAQREAVIATLAAPTTQIVSFTITEKGYGRGAGGEMATEFVVADSFYPLLAEAMRRRRDAGLSGLTLMSCDNLADNGRQLEGLMTAYLDRHEPDLRTWFDAECLCPSTMVDRIVPATTDADRAQLAAEIGVDDFAAVFTEPFSQWVIEDKFSGDHPRWNRVGATLVSDVRPYETAKLRMLNGAHSLLAYVGLAHGHAYVHEAVADPAIRPLVERLLRKEAAPTIDVAPGQDLAAYADALLTRFANPALQHRLIQIAMDGSQKLPQRWLDTLIAQRQRGLICPAILTGLGGWIRHLRGANGPVDDPLADRLAQAVSGADWAEALFGSSGLLRSDWSPNSDERRVIGNALSSV